MTLDSPSSLPVSRVSASHLRLVDLSRECPVAVFRQPRQSRARKQLLEAVFHHLSFENFLRDNASRKELFIYVQKLPIAVLKTMHDDMEAAACNHFKLVYQLMVDAKVRKLAIQYVREAEKEGLLTLDGEGLTSIEALKKSARPGYWLFDRREFRRLCQGACINEAQKLRPAFESMDSEACYLDRYPVSDLLVLARRAKAYHLDVNDILVRAGFEDGALRAIQHTALKKAFRDALSREENYRGWGFPAKFQALLDEAGKMGFSPAHIIRETGLKLPRLPGHKIVIGKYHVRIEPQDVIYLVPGREVTPFPKGPKADL